MIWPIKLLFKDARPKRQPKTNEMAWGEGYYYGKKTYDEYNPDDLIAWKGHAVYSRMMDDDQVKAAFEVIRNIISSRTWKFKVDEDDPQQEKIREFFLYNLDEVLQGTFVQVLKGILLAKAHGFSLSEKVYTTSEFEGRPVWAVKAVKPKPFDTFKLSRDEYGNLLQVVQEQSGKEARIAPEKFIYYVHQADLDPIWGRSDFRAAYPAYWAKQNITKFWNIYDERVSGGTWAFKGKDDAPAMSPSEMADVKSILKTMTAQTGVIVPSGFELDIITPTATNAFENHLSYLDRQIARALLVPNLLGFSDQKQTGSFAQAETQLDVFMQVIKSESEQLADTLNEQLFRELAYWNFGTTKFPRFTFEAYDDKQKREIVETWSQAIQDGAVVNTYEDEIRTRSLLGYPERDDNLDANTKIKPPGIKVEGNSPSQFTEVSSGNTAVNRVDFKSTETFFDKLESDFVKSLSNNVDKMFSDILSSLSEIYDDLSNKSTNNIEESIKKLESSIGPGTKRDFNRSIRDNLFEMYNYGRSEAKSEIKNASKNLPEKFSEKVDLALTFSTSRAVEYHGDNDWSVGNFVEGLNTKEIDKILNATGFHITGVVSDDMLMAARQVLINGIENGSSVSQIVDNLKEILSPLTGSAERDPKTGKLKINKKERARLETIVRTNLSTIYNQAQLSVFTDPDLGDFVEALEYTSLIDKRTTSFCRGYNGFVRPKRDKIWSSITPPNHFNCRSRLIAVTAVDTWQSTEDLPNEDGVLLQPGNGFGSVTSKN